MSKGKIQVETENIFPIIKKFLYSDHEIFLRELVANAVDATTKIKKLSSLGEYKGKLGELQIEVSLDEKAGTLTVSDRGLGMDDADMEKYLNQVAFSGAEEFLKKYKDADEKGIIGHFGLGFYSAFMVAKKVEVVSRSYKSDKAYMWSCDGNPEYEITDAEKADRGTDIILYIDDENKEFLQNSKTGEILNRYCKFLPVSIKFGTKTEYEDDPDGKKDKDGNIEQISKNIDNIINNPTPAWTKAPSEIEAEDYKSFYKELYPTTFDDPLFHIHLNIDYPFELTGILYFPKLKEKLELQRNKIQLYSRQVFITDNVENIVPEYLTLLHGVIDSPDIPLNVSRSYLQSDGNVKKINSYISRKVADKLSEMFKNDREDFEAKWKDIKVFIEYGMLSDEKFNEKMKETYLVKNVAGKHHTVSDYRTKIEATQKDKDDNIVVLYTTNPEEQNVNIAAAEKRGYDVLEIDGPLASHIIGKLEQDQEKVTFKRVDADTLDKLIQKEEVTEVNLTDDQKKQLNEVFEGVVVKDKFQVQLENLNEADQPVQITQSEFMRRMKEQAELGGNMFGGAMPESYNLVVNANHPIVSKILVETDEDKQKQLAKQAADIAMLAQGLLKGKELTAFIDRSLEMIG